MPNRADYRLQIARALARLGAETAWRSFEAALAAPERAQDRVLAKIVSGMSETEYGARYGLKRRDGYAEFRAKLPVVDYDALAPWIDEQRRNFSPVLCPELVLSYELTSGSSGATKWIPHSRSLRGSFKRAFTLWLRDLLVSGPALETGKTWLSVSPFVPRHERTALGVRVGLEHDSDYVGGWLGRLLDPFWVVPPSVRGLTDAAAFRDAVAASLLAAEDLEVISLWNPTMLVSFLEHIAARRDVLLARQTKERARRLSILLDSGDAHSVDWLSIWPRLKLLSCWDQAHARPAAEEARRLLPGVFVQGKGHLATEAPVTIPLIGAGGCVPVVNEVFFEFEEPAGAIRRLHELEEGKEYVLLISQMGGLCRYRLGDRIRAGERFHATPRLELLGRADRVCDLVGEKLNADFAAETLSDAAPESRFKMLVPVPAAQGRAAGYLVVADRASVELGRLVEEGLRRSPQYRHARDMGQLAPLSVCVRADARAVVDAHHVASGKVLGAVKPTPLILDPAEGERLARRLSELE